MSNKKRLPLKIILKNLGDIANEVRTDPSSCENIKQELKGCGYDCEELNEQVIKVLAVAVNEAIRTKVDLSGENKEAVKAELYQLLDDHKHVSSVRYFTSSVSNGLASMSSPLDMAEYLKKNAPQWLVESIIQHQFDIRWVNGDPDDYTFYQFCDNENTTEFFKYKPRQAHVKATLYKECRRESVNDLRGITKENLCPTVYIRTTDEGWVSWQADKEDTFNDVEINTDVENNTGLSPLSWIHSSILTFITENADEQSRGDENLRKSLEKPTLYWAVLNDRDFVPSEKLKLKEIGQTQVYVGRAKRGIKGRWTTGNNHCAKMKKCLDNVCDMTTIMTYDPLRLKGISLVDARLALAKVRGEKTALFVIKTFGDEADESSSETSEDEESDATKSDATESDATESDATESDATESDATESDATDPLPEAEKWHLKGKRVDNEHNDIIPFNDEFKWKPKDMRYGMNRN